MSKLTAAAEEEAELICELAEAVTADWLELMLAKVEAPAALISDSRLAKEEDREAASPVAVARSDDRDSRAAVNPASAEL